jgi:hypothetical protein
MLIFRNKNWFFFWWITGTLSIVFGITDNPIERKKVLISFKEWCIVMCLLLVLQAIVIGNFVLETDFYSNQEVSETYSYDFSDYPLVNWVGEY